MLDVEADRGAGSVPADGGEGTPPVAGAMPPWLRALLIFGACAVGVWLAVWFGAERLPPSWQYRGAPDLGLPGPFEGWARWDATWYDRIARQGYTYRPGAQSSVAFFPAYPLAIRALSDLTGSPFIAGSLLTLLAGFTAAGLLWRWCADRFDHSVALTAVGILALYPYSVYLYGAVYADALFLACAIAAFLFLEREHLWAAGVMGFVATASRPAGIALGIGLLACLLERRARAAGLPARRSWRALRPSDARVLLAFGGLGSFCLFLWVRFGDPLLFAEVQSAPGWDQGAGPRTWFKVAFFEQLIQSPTSPASLGLLLQAAVVVLVLAMVPRVARTIGWGYAVYVLAVVALPLIGSKDLQGAGRYLLPAFPVMAVLAERLVHRPRVRAGLTVVGVAGLLAFSQWFARGNYLS